jgi:hypothetical protein
MAILYLLVTGAAEDGSHPAIQQPAEHNRRATDKVPAKKDS